MTEIIFRDSFPEIAQPKVSEILEKFRWLLPVWMQRLYVNYRGDEKDNSAYVSVEKDYRFGNLTICGHWLNEPKAVQPEQIIHELIHLHFAPLKDYACDAALTLCDGNQESRIFKLIEKELISKNEQGTQDLAFAIMNKFNESNGHLQI